MSAHLVSEAETASFQSVRGRLFGIAYRAVGNAPEAEDVVQEAWIRWQRTDRTRVRDAPSFLATTTVRLSINLNDSARMRRETHLDALPRDPVDPDGDPAGGAQRRDALGMALRVLLERLSPSERAAYVLREAFGYGYRHISDVLGVSEPHARQLARRGRIRISGRRRRRAGAAELQRLLDAFLAASRGGDLPALERALAAAVRGDPHGESAPPLLNSPGPASPRAARSGVPCGS